MSNRYEARPATVKANEGAWYVADRQSGGLNVTVRLFPELAGHLPFLPRHAAEILAAANNRGAAMAEGAS